MGAGRPADERGRVSFRQKSIRELLKLQCLTRTELARRPMVSTDPSVSMHTDSAEVECGGTLKSATCSLVLKLTAKPKVSLSGRNAQRASATES